jgi:ATP-dependent DNA helicase RecG
MTAGEFKALIKGGETLTVEFKRDAPISDADLVEAVVCLANTEGGILLLGVDDDGAVSGLHEKHLPANPRSLEALVANRTASSVRVAVSFAGIGGKTVAVIEVDKADHVVQTSDGRALARVIAGRGKPECRPMMLSEVASRLFYFGHHDYSAQIIPAARWDDLDPLELERLRQTVEESARSDKSLEGLADEDLAKALELVVSREGRLMPTVAGILLAGRERAIHAFVPTHEAAFQVLGEDRNVEFNQFYRESLVKLFFRFTELLEARNREEEVYVLGQRIGVPLYAPSAFREALANALTHRDYAKLNAVYVRLDTYPGSLSITSPGGFVEGVTLDNLLVTGPRPRNRVLADTFKRLGLVERTGRGIERIFEAILGLGRGAPDYSQSDSTTVKVVMPGGKADLEFVKFLVETRNRTQRPLGWPQLLILRYAADQGELTTTEAAELIQSDTSRARSVLEEMVELGLLEPKGRARNRSYHLSAGVYRRLEKPAAYVRRRGFDDVQQEQMVLTYLQTQGKITRSGVAELCQLTLPQAEYLLRKLRKSGKIELIGKGRAARYVLKNSA